MKTKPIVLLIGTLLIVYMLSSCASMMASMELSNAKNRMKEHKYIDALDLAVSSLIYSEYESTEAAELIIEIVSRGDSYYNQLIEQYKASDKGNALAEIFNNYKNLMNLYSSVSKKGLENFTAGGNSYSVNVLDYSKEFNEARNNAGKVYYDAAVTNMSKGTLAGYRQAYYNLDFVKSMYAGVEIPFADLESRLKTSYNEGTIDIYVVVPTDIEMSGTGESMGSIFKSYVTKNSEWVKFHYGSEIDMSYQLWEATVAGERFLDAVSGIITNSNGVLEFGREIGADIVIYGAFDKLKRGDIKKTDHKDRFGGKTTDGEEYTLELSWQKQSKTTGLNGSYFVVDVKSGKTLVQSSNKNMQQEIVLYSGTYVITPNIWFHYSTRDMTELVDIPEIPEYRYVEAPYNGDAYRISYDSPELETRDRENFNEQLANFQAKAEVEALFIIAKKAADESAGAIKDLF